MNTTRLFRRMAGVAALALTGFLSACGGGGKADLPSPNVQAAPTYTISGTLSGLSTGQSVTLLNASTSESLTVNANGNFAFLTAVPQNGSYGVSVKTQPTGQVCSLAAGSGSGSGVVANVSNVQVTCSTDTYTIGGSISGLGSGQSVTLLNNGADALTVSANGTFNFVTSVAYNGSYSVTVGTQPSGQTCSLSAGTGSGSGVVANVSSVQITCSANTYTIGGTLSGLGSAQQVTLLNNGGNALTVTANGAFTFTTPVAYNGSYSVTVGTQPTGQTCTASAASGSGVVANVGTVQITCSANTYTIGGTLSSLGSGQQVTLLNNGGDALTLTANGTFTFTTSVAYNGSYAVTVGTQPTGQTCTASAASGSGVVANVGSVVVTCGASFGTVGTYAITECVKDNSTGLIWEGKLPSGSGPRAGDLKYTNYDSTTSAQKQGSGGFVNPTQADIDAATNSVGYKNYVNSIALCGHTDWRLPTLTELQALYADLDATWLPNTAANYTWSSTPVVGDPTAAWGIDFTTGYANVGGVRGYLFPVRLVRP